MRINERRSYARHVTTFERNLAWGLERRGVPRGEAWVLAHRVLGAIKTKPGEHVDEEEALSLTGARRSEVARILRAGGARLSPEGLYIEAWAYDDKLPSAGGVRLELAWLWRDPRGSAALALARAGAGVRSFIRARLAATLTHLSALFLESLR